MLNNLDLYYSLLFVGVASGVVSYALIVKQGFKDKTFSMPMITICANFCGDFICSFIYKPQFHEFIINLIWAIFDIIFAFQYFRFGEREFPKQLSKKLFVPHFIFILFFCYFTTLCFVDTFFPEDYRNAFKYVGLIDTWIMSMLFCSMYFRRPNLEGQSIYIAFFKMLASICASISFCLLAPNTALLNLICIGICVFDIVYFVLLYRASSNLSSFNVVEILNSKQSIQLSTRN